MKKLTRFEQISEDGTITLENGCINNLDDLVEFFRTCLKASGFSGATADRLELKKVPASEIPRSIIPMSNYGQNQGVSSNLDF